MPIRIEFTPVQSSNLSAIGFVPGHGLFVDFQNGRRYRYPEATQEVHDALLAETKRKDGSVGRKFSELVRKPGLAFEEIDTSGT